MGKALLLICFELIKWNFRHFLHFLSDCIVVDVNFNIFFKKAVVKNCEKESYPIDLSKDDTFHGVVLYDIQQETHIHG